MRTITVFILAVSLAACLDRPPPDTANRSGDLTCQTCEVCAIASFKGPSYYAQNFASYNDAKSWLASFGDAPDKEIISGPCAVPVACPETYSPLCGQVTGSDVETTYDNSCELGAATRLAAGSSPPGAAKGVTLHDGACAPAPTDPCAGKSCGDACAGPYANPLPTFCDASGSCVAGPVQCDTAYSCDTSKIICDIPIPQCDPGYTPSVSGLCYGPCVPIGSCKCEPGVPTECPEDYVCHANTMRCGPYVATTTSAP